MRRLLVLAVILHAVPAHAGNLQVPSVTLPSSELTTPSLLFGPGDVATLSARRTNPAFSGYYNQVKGTVDGQLSGLKNNAAGLGDDTLSRVAKGAAILHQLGETPASQFATYRDAAVSALKAIGSRSPGTGLGGNLDVLQDSPRLQSMAEAYDLLRGTGVASADDTAIRNRLANWADAFLNDVNLTGVFGVGAHRDNWGIKGGSALLSTALAMSSHGSAGKWFTFGMQLMNESFAAVASDTGWWRESPHYVNYTLNNLVSVAVHVKNRTGVDWFPALRPLVTTALDMRQPDGFSIPFEEGVTNVFPFDVLAAQYPDLAPQMRWAWTTSTRDASAYENQAFHVATRFVLNTDDIATAPSWSPTRFIGADAHVQVLRSDWGLDAQQATMITAKDHSSSTLVASRHNMQNPLDLSIYGGRQLLLVTSSGGPQVTNSANRNYYLQPSSRNVPLISGTAPYITDESKITSDRRLDSAFLDVARTSTTAYANTSRISRTLAMVGDRYFIVADEAAGAGALDYTLPFRGRGTYTGLSSAANRIQTRWEYQNATLDLWSLSDQSLTLKTTSGYYASGWNKEETIAGIEVKLNTTNPHVLTVVEPHVTDRASLTVSSLGGTSAQVTDGTFIDTLTFGDNGFGDNGLGVVRTHNGAVVSFGVAGRTFLEHNGKELVNATSPMTLSGTVANGGLTLRLSEDMTAPVTFTMKGPFDFTNTGYYVKLDGQILDSSRVHQLNGYLVLRNIPPGATLELLPSTPPELQGYNVHVVAEGQLLETKVSGSDIDGQTLTYSYTSSPSLPGTPTFDAATGQFSWTPDFDVATRALPATFVLEFTVTDGFYTATFTTTVEVQNVNRPPDFPPLTTQTVAQGSELKVPLGVTDPDLDTLSYEVSLVGSDTIAPPPIDASGTLTWTPSTDVPPGMYGFAIKVSDGLASVSGNLLVEVKRLNHAPTFDAPLEPLSAKVGELHSFIIHALDPDGEAVTYDTTDPRITLNVSSGRVEWTPTAPGETSLHFTARDPGGETAELTVVVNVTGSPVVEQPPPETPSTTKAATGCGCTTASTSAALLLLPLLLRRRKQRH